MRQEKELFACGVSDDIRAEINVSEAATRLKCGVMTRTALPTLTSYY